MKQVHNAKYYILKENRLNRIPLKNKQTNKEGNRLGSSSCRASYCANLYPNEVSEIQCNNLKIKYLEY